ncbi:GNAT family N-acetyltransferase [Dankookia rubra]|uniref:GNAT family N-acetyltransferase n=1 Tax=Dankookia rubra TaxID=1442381 RepID=A0A4R5Q837_9PROT|nr:GNAT family N-acetyltransferase [Dankookia rubra]TDH58906.1 GNAT family N-acetyltransferase [Dankookia rubra]
MRIRDAAPADAAACDLLRRSIAALCGADHGGDPAAWLVSGTPADLAAWIGAPGNVVLPAEAAGRLLGVGATTAAGKVRLTYVAPEARRRGVSRTLPAALEDRACAAGQARCTLHGTLTARRFYAAAG